MRKVTTINLNGRAYQLEEAGYSELHAYILRAEKQLSGNPDKAEVLSDIEQAIADKCETHLQAGKTVINEAQIAAILKQMGEVHAEPETTHDSSDAQPDEPKRTKRLFVIKEGALLAGVCQGLGVYFGIDAILIRIIFVGLTFITSGFWILVYLLLAVVLPYAKTDAELAEAYGKPMTAQDVVNRFKDRAPDNDALRRLADIGLIVSRIIIKIISVTAAVLFGVITASWIWSLWMSGLGNMKFYDQLSFMNGWREIVLLGLAYIIIAIPLFILFKTCNRVAEGHTQSRATMVTEYTLCGIWLAGIVAGLLFVNVYGSSFRSYADAHQGFVKVGDTSICIDSTVCTNGVPAK